MLTSSCPLLTPTRDLEVGEEPGGSPWILRSYSGPRGCVRNRGSSRDPEVVEEPGGSPWILRSYSGPEGFSLRSGDRIGNPEVLRDVMTPMRSRLHRGTVLCLPRQDYYRYLFGFRIPPLGSWPLSSSYVVFNFCRKSLTGLEGAGVGVMNQVPCFAASHVWRSRILIAPWTPMRLRLHRGFRLARIGGLWRPDPARMPL
ncbi:hypothetical protein DY000_02053554 [Brassica cretica]|uniref:Uncharacterized protein n=1 Tax=Brassica cretica TaxID=69181 RepID=A0ABQ7AJ01_BRACR|nr:hypothetical protein DY000_02053554 [Brassica cretica]